MTTTTLTRYQHLESRPGSNYRQLFLKGRRIRAAVVDEAIHGPDPRTPEEFAQDYQLPLEAVLEALEYVSRNRPLIEQERDREAANIHARGLDTVARWLLSLLILILSGCGRQEAGPAKVSAEFGDSLVRARHGFKTKLVRTEADGVPMPEPPPALFRIVGYDSPAGKLSALLSPAPKDVAKSPAILWITSGNCNSIDDGIWRRLPTDFDQTALAADAFRQAGIVMMFPTLRGGNSNPGFKEGLFGEVDDVLAAAEFLAGQPHVDARRIYLGGLSTGGTLALLTAESTDRFRGVFAFGAADVVTDHSPEYLPFDTNDPREVRLRSPIHWLPSIRSEVFAFEGVEGGNVQALTAMKRACTNPRVHFYAVEGAGHVTVLGPVARLIAGKIARDTGPETSIIFTGEEVNGVFAR